MTIEGTVKSFIAMLYSFFDKPTERSHIFYIGEDKLFIKK